MVTDTSRPVLNPVLRFTKDPRPESVAGGGKTANNIKVSRLATQRRHLSSAFRELAALSADQPSFSGRTVIYASMFDDSLAPSWTPRDIFSPERGARLMTPFRSGYLLEVETRHLNRFSEIIETASRVVDQVDISRVQNVRFFDEEDAVSNLSLDEAWAAAPKLDGGRAFLIWLMPLRDQSAGELLLERVIALREHGVAPAPPLTTQLELDLTGAPAALIRSLRVAETTDRFNSALRTYRRSRQASTTVVVANRASLTQLVASGTVYRLEPVRPIASTAPGEGREPDRPLPRDISTMPIVGVVDGGLTAPSYMAAQAWRAPSFIADAHADYVHGNRVTSLVVQGHDWNNKLNLPAVYCQIGTVQAVPKRGTGAIVDPESFIQYLDAVMGAYPNTKVWNLSFNEPAPCDLEAVSYLGHNIALLARKHDILPIISVGNKPGNLLQPPADCEAAITVGGRQHCEKGLAAGACPISLQGPGPSSMLKPEMSHFSHVRVIGGLVDKGSSYSTALASPLAAHTMERLRNPSPDLAKTLVLHSIGDGSYDTALGFGSPTAAFPWETPAGSVTLQWSAALKPGAAYYWELPIPASLRKTGKLKGFGKLTAILNPHPLVTEIAGPNYFSARLETALQIERGEKFPNLLGSMETGKLTEEQARTIDHKWSPIRHHAKTFKGVKFDGENLRVYARCFTRDLYLYSYASTEEVPEMDVVFALSLGTGNQDDDVYGELRTALGAFVESATIDLNVDIDQQI